MKKTIPLAITIWVCSLNAQIYTVGDYVSDFSDSLCNSEAVWSLYDNYGEMNGGDNKIVWLIFFNPTSRRCQLEATYTQTLYNLFSGQGLTAAGIGAGWNEHYNCKSWSKNFGVTYPLLDDTRMNLRSLFAETTVPHHVIIDHNMQVVFSAKGTIMPPDGNDFLIALSTALQNMISLSNQVDPTIPEKAALYSCYPNPFNITTTIAYSLNRETPVQINVIDMLGKTSTILENKTHQPSGSYRISWNAQEFSSGIYFIQLITDRATQYQKVLLVK